VSTTKTRASDAPGGEAVEDSNPDDDQFTLDIPLEQTFDLALVQIIDDRATPAPYSQGSKVQFEVTVHNQGTLDAYDIEIRESVPPGLMRPSLVDGQEGISAGEGSEFKIAQVKAGESVSFLLEAMVANDFMGSELIMDAEIMKACDIPGGINTTDEDSTAGDNATPNDLANDNDIEDKDGGDDQDPVLVEIEQVFDLAIRKMINEEATPAPYEPGDKVRMVITLDNNGTLDAYDIDIEESLPEGLTSIKLVGAPQDVLETEEGKYTVKDLNAGNSKSFEVEVEIDPSYMEKDLRLTTTAVKAAASPGGEAVVDDKPEDNQFAVDIAVEQTFDLALTNQIDVDATPGPYMPGDKVQLSVIVDNKGTLDAYDIDITEIATEGLESIKLMGEQAGVTETESGKFTINNIGANESIALKVEAIISPDFIGKQIPLVGEITKASDTAGGNNVEDDMPTDNRNEVVIQVTQNFDLALTITLSPGQSSAVTPGSDVSFDITVYNQGVADAHTILVNDYVPSGFTFDPALNSDFGPDSDGDGSPDASITGPIAANDSETLTIVLTVNDPFDEASMDIMNYAEISAADNDTDPDNDPPMDMDSTPDANQSNDGDAIDDEINQDGLAGGDEDDHDFARVFVQTICEAIDAFDGDICIEINADLNHPWADSDCDGGGVAIGIECANGGDASDPLDECIAAINASLDICAIIAENPNATIAGFDCDGGGIDNATECANGGNPSDPSDECDIAIASNADVCTLILADSSIGLANDDCDNSGISNAIECANGGDPMDSSNECATALASDADICALIAADPSIPLASEDCDNGGIINSIECDNGGDPSDESDDCQTAIVSGIDICTILSTDPSNTLASKDCDSSGIDNATECANGGNPSDPTDECDIVIASNVDVCAILASNPDSQLANQDCDQGGVSNIIECQTGSDPKDSSDDSDPCVPGYNSGKDLCAAISIDPFLAAADCDGGGIDNATECEEGTDPNDPTDDCIAAIAASADICSLVLIDPSSSLATADCDGGGISNYDECLVGEDPSDSSDDCQAAMEANVDICVLVVTDPDGQLANEDCDGGGVNNLTECLSGENPLDHSDDCQTVFDETLDICVIIAANPMSTIADADCDGGGISNAIECENGGDPTNPTDDCAMAEAGAIDICLLINGDANHPLAQADCDGGGITNLIECISHENPFDSSDDCSAACDEGIDIHVLIAGNPDHPLAQADCDGGGMSNFAECLSGEDPCDPSDDCQAVTDAGLNICSIVLADPSGGMATADCDGGGIDNFTECNLGGDPTNPGDDCTVAIENDSDICTLISDDPTHPIALVDCDGGGVSNGVECTNGGNPLLPEDDCQMAIDTGADICALIEANPSSDLASADCDDGGVDNATECAAGGNPANPVDDYDCETAISNNVDICGLISDNPNIPLANLDCDGGGVSNAVECGVGNDPADSSDDCASAVLADLNICLLIAANPSHPLADEDCDGGGVSNIVECQTGEEPSDTPEDDCQAAIDSNVDLCVLIDSDPSHPLADQDCDGGGVSNIVECQTGEEPGQTPGDDCQSAINAGILEALIADVSNPLHTSDCDGDGTPNAQDDDPLDPCIDYTGTPDPSCGCLVSDPNQDCDGDGNPNGTDTDPEDPCVDPLINLASASWFALDCDEDGLTNGDEQNSGSDPFDPCDPDPLAVPTGDCDSDGLANGDEPGAGTDPVIQIHWQ